MELKQRELCNWLIRNKKVKPYQVIKHSYSTNRMNGGIDRYDKFFNICPAITTRCDCLGVVVYEMVSEEETEPHDPGR